MFHGGNPFDWYNRSDYPDDSFGFGGDDGDGGEGLINNSLFPTIML